MDFLPDLSNIDDFLPAGLDEDQKARIRTAFLKEGALALHEFYGGKMQSLPKCSIQGFNWLNLWYTPGVSKISTSLRDKPESSFALSNRGNLVAVVSDSTRVLGDGDCGPAGGLGVMEGKAMLMKYLGGVDATALCIDSRNREGKSEAAKIIDFVKMLQPSFGAINLEDISQPDCYRVLDELRESCDIPVWHDDAQGTACVSLAALINALKLAGKELSQAKIVLLGAGAANTTIARLLLADGAQGKNLALFDTVGGLHSGRQDLEQNPAFYRKWELCQSTNPQKFAHIDKAIAGADVLIALSSPGPDILRPEWIQSMAKKAIVFACANPVPEIWPHRAKKAGAFIVATGRGDFPNQVNNSICFPGILKGALLVRAKKISDSMAIRCAYSIADFSEKRGIHPDNIIATMEESEVYAVQAADVGRQAIAEGHARIDLSWDELYSRAKADIDTSRNSLKALENAGLIAPPPQELLHKALRRTLEH